MRTSNLFKVKFLGVRGSYNLSDSKMQRYGGNTSAIEIETETQRIFIDAGSGITKVVPEGFNKEMTLYFSHYHWDHILGLPFFTPLYDEQASLLIRGMAPEKYTLNQVVEMLFDTPFCPIGWDSVKDRTKIEVINKEGSEVLEDIKVDHIGLRHPGGSVGYRFTSGDKVVVILTDIEMSRAFDTYEADFNRLRDFVNQADVLIMDGSMTNEEYYGKDGSNKVGWGHSPLEECILLAQKGQVKKTYMTHYLPNREDQQNDEILKQIRKKYEGIYFAQENEVIVL